MDNQEINNNGQIQIELKEDVAQGTYANLAIITHSSSEFILDFIKMLPGMPKASVQSRIVLVPEHAKRLLRALEECRRASGLKIKKNIDDHWLFKYYSYLCSPKKCMLEN